MVNSVTMDARMVQDWNVIMQDESLMERLARYMRRLVKEKEADPTLMTKDEFFARVDEAQRQINEGKGHSFTDISEMNAWLDTL